MTPMKTIIVREESGPVQTRSRSLRTDYTGIARHVGQQEGCRVKKTMPIGKVSVIEFQQGGRDG